MPAMSVIPVIRARDAIRALLNAGFKIIRSHLKTVIARAEPEAIPQESFQNEVATPLLR